MQFSIEFTVAKISRPDLSKQPIILAREEEKKPDSEEKLSKKLKLVDKSTGIRNLYPDF